MKKVFVSNKTPMVLRSLNNISTSHTLYKTYYEKEVNDDYHINVGGNAKVYGNARVFDNAKVRGNALVCGNAEVYDNAMVYGNAQVRDNALVYGNAQVRGNAIVYDNAYVFSNALVCGNAQVTKDIINIEGLPFSVTLTDNHIQIGCKQFTFKTIRKLYDKNININSEDYNKIIKYKNLLLELIKTREVIEIIKLKQKIKEIENEKV